jgi:hypothetical protein
MSPRLVLAVVAGVLLGAGGMWLALAPAPSPATPPQVQAAGVTAVPAAASATDVEAIRAAVRQELHAAAFPPPAPAPSVAVAPAPEKGEDAPTDEADAAPPSPEFVGAKEVVEEGLARRTWSTEDRRQLQELLPRLLPAEREQLAKQLIAAANRGEIVVDVSGPLF